MTSVKSDVESGGGSLDVAEHVPSLKFIDGTEFAHGIFLGDNHLFLNISYGYVVSCHNYGGVTQDIAPLPPTPQAGLTRSLTK